MIIGTNFGPSVAIIFKLANFFALPKIFLPTHLNTPLSSTVTYFMCKVWLSLENRILELFSISSPFLYQFTTGLGIPIILQIIVNGLFTDRSISSPTRFVSRISGFLSRSTNQPNYNQNVVKNVRPLYVPWPSTFNVLFFENVSCWRVIARHSYVPALLVLMPFQLNLIWYEYSLGKVSTSISAKWVSLYGL